MFIASNGRTSFTMPDVAVKSSKALEEWKAKTKLKAVTEQVRNKACLRKM
jgi:hypothetical protein